MNIPTNETMKQARNEGGGRKLLEPDVENVRLKDDDKNTRLNVQICKLLKKRAKSYCAVNEVTLKDLVALALESTLDELEGKTA
jgi:hypothetical protein